MKIQVTKFAERHFNKSFTGTKIFSHTPEKFENEISERITDFFNGNEEKKFKLLDGYAPFCKLFVVPNFTDAKTGTLPITLENYQYLRTGYSARRESELPVLSRWFEIPKMFIPDANFLVVVLYSREQLFKEHEAKEAGPNFKLDEDTPFGVVAILGQMSDEEEPMKPITMLRNAMGEEHGGSGVEINENAYKFSVNFWSKNATVK